YLHKLLQLKYPVHVNAITLSRAEEILQEHSSITLDYQEMIEDGDADEFDEAIRGFEIKSYEDLQKQLTIVQTRIDKNKQRIAAAANPEEHVVEPRAASSRQPPTDPEAFQVWLTETRAKSHAPPPADSRPQTPRRSKCGSLRRAPRYVTSLNPEEHVVEPRAASSRQPPTDPEAFQVWLTETRAKYRDVVGRRDARRSRRAAMVKRRTAAAAERMRVISHLAAAGDEFGNEDSDWDAYKRQRLRSGRREAAGAGGVPERVRAAAGRRGPAGLAETLEYVFKQFTAEDQLLLANNVFITGGASQFPGNILNSSRQGREGMFHTHAQHFELNVLHSSHRVVMARNASLDAWYGARDFAGTNDFEACCITKEEYYEMGGEFLKEHHASNKYYRSPAPPPLLDPALAPAGDANQSY
ncbi:Actin-related protein 5, partial [Operophtera brumata]